VTSQYVSCLDPRPHRQIEGAPPQIIGGVSYKECGHPIELPGGSLTYCGALYVIQADYGRPCCCSATQHISVAISTVQQALRSNRDFMDGTMRGRADALADRVKPLIWY